MNLRKALGSLFLLATFTFVPPVFAGGEPVYIDLGSTLSSWDNPSSPRQIVAKVHLHRDVPCVGTKITFKYEDQKDGDNVSTGADGNTYTIQEVGARWLNGKSVYDCGTYAKYTSKNKELKYGIIVVTTPKGETHERKVALNFQNNDPIISSDESLPWDNEVSAASLSIPTNLRVTQIETTNDPNTRNVHILWDSVKDATSYNIYTNAGSGYYYHNTVDTNLYEMKVSTKSVFYISVSAKKNGIESDRRILTIDLANIKTDTVENPTTPTPSTVTTPSDNSKVDELNKKVENLQDQLDESKKTQSVLEQRINDLVNFIKTLFPFFK